MRVAPFLVAALVTSAGVASFQRFGREAIGVDAAPAAGAGHAHEEPPGIVVLCLDTLRADALALDSGRPVRMPRLEAFARESVAFADAVAPAAWTVPSTTSLLTGLDPSHTGVLGLPEHVGEPPSGVVSLAARLSGEGWDAAAVTAGGFLFSNSRTLRGFRETTVGLDQGPAASLAGWNRRRPRGVPFFLYLHSLAAHSPYVDRDPRASPSAGAVEFDVARARSVRTLLTSRPEAVGPADARWMFEAFNRSGVEQRLLESSLGAAASERARDAVWRWLDGWSEEDPTCAALGERMHGAYREGLVDVDRLFGRLLDALEALGLPDGTAVFVVADHGEAFAEHGTFFHGRRLFDELVRVPLLVRGAPRLGPPRVVRGASGLVDVAPTVLDLAGLAPPAGLDGISLAAALAHGGDLPDRAMRGFEERHRYVGDVDLVERLESFRTPRAKCIVRRDPATRRVLGADVYDLLFDPAERVAIPLADVDRPCEFGDAFARALEETGFAVPCLEARLPGGR